MKRLSFGRAFQFLGDTNRPVKPPHSGTAHRVAPNRPIKVKLDANDLSRDPGEVARVTADPMTDIKTTPRSAVVLFECVDWVHANAPRFNTPLLMMQGDSDRIALPVGSQKFYDRVTMEDKTFKLYSGGYHQPFIDTNRDEVFTDLNTWLDRHID